MSTRALLGRSASLTVDRFAGPGAYLRDPDDADAPAVLLPKREIPEGAAVGDAVDVFVYLDSEDRPIATVAKPKVELGQVAFLRVTSLVRFGAFVDWGLPKELLVPFSEQTTELRVGHRHPIGLYVDESGRLAGTMRVSEMLGKPPRALATDERVAGECWRNDPDIGLFVILERSFVGLVPAQEPHRQARGDAVEARVVAVHPDGKVELSLRGHAHEELDGDAERILSTLRGVRPPRLGDHSPPEAIRSAVGLSKKAYKRAVGRLLKRGDVRLDDDECVVAVSRTAPERSP